jgi:FeS assembly SUF system protein
MTHSVPVYSDIPELQATKPSIDAQGDPLVEKIIAQLRQIYDPEIPVNLYDLGLIYDIQVDGLRARILMTLTTPNCPVADSMPDQVASVVRALDEIDEVDVELTWDPPWSPDGLSDEVRLELGLL